MYCRECGVRNEDTAEYCKKCNATIVHGSQEGLRIGTGLIGYSDPAIGILIVAVGVILGIAAVLPLLLLHTKDLVIMERMRLIVTIPMGLIALMLIAVGGAVYQGHHRRHVVLEKVRRDYRSLVDNAADGIFTIDRTGRFTYLNKRALELLGYSKEELVGTNFIKVIAPDYKEHTIENFGKRRTGEAIDRYECELVTKDGGIKRVELSTRTLEHKGEFMGVEGIAREVLKKKRRKK